MIGESAGANRVCDGCDASAQKFVPRWKTFLQGGKGAMAVSVARRLREDDFDEHVERVARTTVLRHAVSALKILDDVADRLLY